MDPKKFLKYIYQRSFSDFKKYYPKFNLHDRFLKKMSTFSQDSLNTSHYFKKMMSLNPQQLLKLRMTIPHSIKNKKLDNFLFDLANMKRLNHIRFSMMAKKLNMTRFSTKDFTNFSLHYSSDNLQEDLIQTCMKDMSYLPTLYLYHPFLQSVYNVLTPERYNIDYKRDIISLPDQGQISLDWAYSAKEMPEKKILFILHGLTGGSEMPYVQSLVAEAMKEGFRTVVCHNRGINKTYLTTPEPFNGIILDDLDHAFDHIRKTHPDYKIYAVGLSLGGNLMFRYTAQKKDEVPYKALVAIATPFDLEICINNIGWVYQKFFLKRYIDETVKPNLDILRRLEKTHNIDFDKILQVKSVEEFHENFTAKVFGYKNAREYFRAAKIEKNHIENIKIPTFLLHARDDPITTIKCVPVEELKKNKHIVYAETKYGGHVCWFFGSKPKRWYPKPTLEFLKTFKFDESTAQIFNQESYENKDL